MHLRACELCGMCMEPMDHMHPLGRTGGTAVGSQQVKVTPKTAFTSKWYMHDMLVIDQPILFGESC